MILTVALITDCRIQLLSNNEINHILENIEKKTLKKYDYWIAYDDEKSEYIISNKTQNIINKVKNIAAVVDLISN